MFTSHRLTLSLRAVSAAALVAAGGLCGSAHADIAGFAPGSINPLQRDSGTAMQLTGGGTGIQITTGSGQVRTVWFFQPQPITQFTARFTYQATSIGASGVPAGIAFIVQSAASGANALGTGFNLTGFGYDGISPSIAVTIENDLGVSRTGFYRNGVIGGGSQALAPVSAYSFHPINVTIQYSGALLSVTMTDTVTGQSAPAGNYLVSPSIATALGSGSAYIGFGASTGQGNSNQFISNFSYTVPSPCAAALLGLCGIHSGRRRRR